MSHPGQSGLTGITQPESPDESLEWEERERAEDLLQNTTDLS